jgi:integrase
MTGHIRRRGNGYELRWRVRGKLATTTFHGSKKDANAKLRDLLGLADQGVAPAKGTCAEWFDRWLLAIRNDVSPLTWRLYESNVRCIFKPAFGSLKLAELDMFTIRAAWAGLGDRLAPSSIRVAHSILSASLGYAVEGRLIAHNPCTGWRRGYGLPQKTDNDEVMALDREQVATLIEASRGTPLFAPVILALGLGARRGEISALRWNRVADNGRVSIREALKELKADDIRVGPPKGKKRRDVVLPTSYFALLREWRRIQAEQLLRLGKRVGSNDFICTDEAGRLMTPGRIGDHYRTLARRVGITLPFHFLRHTHASLLLEAGESVKVVQLRLGHTRPSMTLDVYGHRMPVDDEAEAKRLDDRLAGREPE